MKKIKKQLQDTSTLSHLANINKPMQEKFNKYWLKMKEFSAISKVFDPCCKLEHLGFILSENTANPDDPAAISLVDIKSTLSTWFKEVVSSQKQSTSTTNTGKSADPNQSQTLIEDNDDLNDKKYLKAKKATHVVSTTAELDLYLQEPPILINSPSFSLIS
jgi:hypothetical protein